MSHLRGYILIASISLSLGILTGSILTIIQLPSTTYAEAQHSASVVFSPISTDVYTPTLVPMALPGYLETVKISYYRPELGGTNCSRFVNGECISRMASGERWQDWYGRAAACPREWQFWTTIVLPGGENFFCLDRGGAIRYGADGLTFIDLLVKESPVPFGTHIEVRVIPP